MFKAVAIKIDEIYVPAAHRKELDPEKVDATAEQIMEETEANPIQVRKGKDRYVLVKGVHRLEARKALGDEVIHAYIVGAKQH